VKHPHYTDLTVHLLVAQIVTFYAQTEQDMNAVERVTVYAELPPEGDPTTPNDPPPSWPPNGAITFRDVALAYREGLPLVLKDVNFEIKAGEKVSLSSVSSLLVSSCLPRLESLVEQEQVIFV
jgi:ATP-binding cassette, subfamily C (CFTR/MRP), member 1